MKKISYKILFGLFGVMVISLIVLVLISFRNTKDDLNETMNEKLLNSIDYYSNTVEKDIESIQNYLSSLELLLRFDLEKDISANSEEIKNKLELFTKKNELEAAYLYLSPEYFDKEYVFNYEKSLGVYTKLGGGDKTDELVKKFITDPKQKTISYWTRPEYVQILNKSVVYSLEKIYIGEQLVGAYGIAFDFEKIRKDLENQSFYKEGRIIVLNKDYEYIYMSRSDDNKFSLNLDDPRLVGSMRGISSGVTQVIEGYDFDGKSGQLVIRKLENGWTILGVLDTYKFLTLLNKAVIILGVLLIIIVLFLVSVSFSVAHEVVQPVSEIVEDLNVVAKGNLRVRTQIKGSPDVKKLSMNLNKFLEKFEDTLNDIKITTNHIVDSSRDILFFNKKLEGKTLEQSNAIKNAYRVSEDVRGLTKLNVEKLEKLKSITVDAGIKCEELKDTARVLKTSMEAISSSSKKISTVLDIIDEIAFQTNLLSLNATVEAAKSGKYGKGFAVVASEIRNLAVRRSDASREMKTKISNDIGIVKNAKDTLSDNIIKLEEMQLSVKKIEEIIDVINKKTAEQDDSINRIKDSIDDLDDVSKLTIQIAESNSKLVNQLFNETDRFLDMIDYFEGR